VAKYRSPIERRRQGRRAAPVVQQWNELLAGCAASHLAAWVQRYLVHQRIQGDREATVLARLGDLRRFVFWAVERALAAPQEITRPVIERYQRHLFHYRTAAGLPLSINRQRQSFRHLGLYFGWLVRQNVIAFNPVVDLELPKRRTDRLVDPISHAEVEQVLAVLNVEDLIGLRDRAMLEVLEVLYSTGIRRTELIRLDLADIDRAHGTVYVRQGKGAKDRHVPIGERALAWLERYLSEVWPELVIDPRQAALFVNAHGARMEAGYLGHRVRGILKAAGISKPGACHLFRHAMATEMLEHGADVRYIQEILGHSSLATTQIYTHVSIGKLKAVHAATHPAARLGPKGSAVGEGEEQ